MDSIKFNWDNSFNGVMSAPNGDIKIGEDGFRPYNLFIGALGSCFYATLITIVNKKRLTFDSATMEISGEKRTTSPTTLEWAVIKLVVKNPSNIEQFDKSIELAAKNCSIHETISKVADIKIITEYTK